MTLLDTYNSFVGALATGQPGLLPAFVDPDAYTETCVGLTGWTQGLDVALANLQAGSGYSSVSASSWLACWAIDPPIWRTTARIRSTSAVSRSLSRRSRALSA
jgi:hypothetical protein